jgi:hypothetical protein
MNENRTWAWYEIRNQSRFPVLCQLGRISIQDGSQWSDNTNSMGYQYPLVMPGESRVLDLAAPESGEKLRVSFFVSKLPLEADGKKTLQYTLQYRIRRFVDGLRLDRIGVHISWKPEKPVEIYTEDVELLSLKNTPIK